MKYAISAAAAVALSLSASSAFAQEQNDAGFYVGAGVGQFNVQIDDVDQTDEAIQKLDDDDNSWKAFVGWRFNPFLSLELAYIDFGDVNGTFRGGNSTTASGSGGNYDVSISGFAPYVIGTIPLGPIELFGKAGYYFYDVDQSYNFDQPLSQDIVDSSSSESDFMYGAGVGVTFLQHVNVRLEYERIDSSVVDDADALWLSGAWRF
ncbi:MAG TPA: porin family protein [Steroidobacteraceae bacterium]|nr:porin family protein [Steroidobacteraceae bacterium]